MGTEFKEIFTLAAKYFSKEFKKSGGLQKMIAMDLGITTSYLSAVINGSKTASLSLAEDISFKLSNRPLDEFLVVGRRIKKGLLPIQEERLEIPDSPEELISKLTHYIVDYKRIKRALEDEQWLFQEAINMVDFGIVIAGIDRKVLAYNKVYQEIFRYPEEILATKDMGAYVRYGRHQMADLEQFDIDLREAFATMDPISHIVELKDGRNIRRDIFPLTRDGKLVGRLAHLHDVPPTKKRKSRGKV